MNETLTVNDQAEIDLFLMNAYIANGKLPTKEELGKIAQDIKNIDDLSERLKKLGIITKD